MGDTLALSLGSFGAHAMENHLIGPRAVALGKSTVTGPKVGSGTESPFWREPQNGLQVEGAVYGRRAAGAARSAAAAPAFAPASLAALAEAHQSPPPPPPALGGGKKLHARLRALHAGGPVPAVRTITRWLGRWQLSRKRRRRPPKGPVMPRRKLTLGRRANAVWTVDFKGWWRTADRCRVEPLTVRDLYSRYVLAVGVLPDQQWERVQRVFLGLFRRYGLPRVIRVDNGGPFGSTGPAGLSRLSAWWVSVGLRVEFIRPAHPQDNGAHEQMHRELKGEAARPVSSTVRAQQRRLERWRRGYNQVRPHEALAQQPPSRKYRRSARRYSQRALRWQYAPGWAVRRVRSNGQIRWAGRLRFVGEAFVGYRVGLRGKATGVWHVYFHHILLGELRALDRCGLRPAVYHSGRFHKGAKKPKV